MRKEIPYDRRREKREKPTMNGYILIGIFVAYMLLNFIILPKLGVPT